LIVTLPGWAVFQTLRVALHFQNRLPKLGGFGVSGRKRVQMGRTPLPAHLRELRL